MPALFHDTASEALVRSILSALASCGHQHNDIGADRQREGAGALQQLIIGWAGTAEGLLSVQHRSALSLAGAGCLVHVADPLIPSNGLLDARYCVVVGCRPGAPFNSALSFT